jgi:nucleoside 2-deoxyribosyltransferase
MEMPKINNKIFLAGPFKSIINPETNQVYSHHQSMIDNLIRFFEENGYEVHNAHKREGWGKKMMLPEECTKIDFEEISSCQYFVAFPGSPASPGTHIEIGWASALKKRVFLLLEKEKDYAFLIRGLYTIASVEMIYYKDESDYLKQIKYFFDHSKEIRQV